MSAAARASKKSAHTKALLAKITKSKQGIAAAEGYLAKMVREVEIVARAEKRTITHVVQEALKKLSKARADLEALEKMTLEEP